MGAGLAGLVATHELVKAGRRVLIVEQENSSNLGGQAFWSLGGLFFVDSPEQRRLGIKDSRELALQDWMGSAGFDREREDHWPRQWAEAYVDFAATEKRDYLHDLGLRVVPIVGWAERGGGSASGHGNSVPRFHLTWGTGPETVRVFAEPGAGGGVEGAGLVRLPPPGRRADGRPGRGGGRARHRARAVGRGAGREELTRAGRGVRAARRGGGGDLGRHRPQPRARSPQLAHRPAGSRTRAHDHGGPRSRGRADARDQPGRRGEHRQLGPDVALRRGHPQLGQHLARPRDPDHSRALVAVARRDGQADGGPEFPGLRHAADAAADPRHGLRLLVVRPDPVDHRARVRALGVRAEPGHHRQGPQADAALASLLGCARPGRGVQGARGRLRGPRLAARSGRGHERDRSRASARCRRRRARDRGPRPRGGQQVLEGPAADGDSQRARVPG